MEQWFSQAFRDSLYGDINWVHYNWLNSRPGNVDFVYGVAMVAWLGECVIVIDYLCLEYFSAFFLFPFNVTFVLIVGIAYWSYLWGMAGWRRTQYGSFTSGDRKLWAKGYAAFWIVELVTVVSFVLIFGWLSWGPKILIPSYFIVPRRGLVLEFIVYSYLIFLTYIAKFSMKWNLGNFQVVISLFAVIVLSYLLWRDMVILLNSDAMQQSYSARWRNVNLTALVYALSHEWWVGHSVGDRAVNFSYSTLPKSFIANVYPLAEVPLFKEYESNLWLAGTHTSTRLAQLYLYCADLFNISEYYAEFSVVGGRSSIYPSRVGFIPNRLAIWQFLLFLKIWHQLVILLWWMLYLLRLKMANTGSFQFLAVCYFNVYCCYILGLLIYSLSYFGLFESILRFSPGVFSINSMIIFTNNGLAFIWDCLVSWESYPRVNEALRVFESG